MSSITKFEQFQPQLLTFGEPKSGKHGQVYIPICYKGERLQFTTGKCFSWGLQKDKKGEGYKLPVILKEKEGKLPHQEQFCEFLKSVGEIAKRYCKDNPSEIAKTILLR